MHDDIKIEDFPANFQEVAEVVGIEKALELSERFAGTSIYVPKLEDLNRRNNDDIEIDKFPANFRKVVELIGVESALKMSERFEGNSVYVPKFENKNRKDRNNKIRKAFTGANIPELCQRFGLSEIQVRSIVRIRKLKQKTLSKKERKEIAKNKLSNKINKIETKTLTIEDYLEKENNA